MLCYLESTAIAITAPVATPVRKADPAATATISAE